VDAKLMPLAFRLAQHIRKVGGDHRRRQQGAVEHGFDAIYGESLGAQHLFQETGSGEDAPNCLAGIVRPH